MNELTDSDLKYMQSLSITVEDLGFRINREDMVQRHDLTILIKDHKHAFVRVALEDPDLSFYYIQIY